MARAAPAPADGRSDAGADSRWVDEAELPDAAPGIRARWARLAQRQQRLLRLMLLGLVGVALLLCWLRFLAASPHLPGHWQAVQNATGAGLQLQAADTRLLRPELGQTLRGLNNASALPLEATSAWLPRPTRWIVDDGQRATQLASQVALANALTQPTVQLVFDGREPLVLTPPARGLTGLGLVSWGVCLLALALYMAAVVTWVAHPGANARLFVVLALSQCLTLALISAESLPGLGQPAVLADWAPTLRLWADLVGGAALVHLLTRYPRPLAWRGRVVLPVWALALVAAAGASNWPLPQQWWWLSGLTVGFGLVALWVLARAQQQAHQPMVTVLQGFTAAGTGTLVLLSAAVALSAEAGPVQTSASTVGSVLWVVFFASMLMLAPFLSRPRQVMREFALLAGMGTLAVSLYLLLVALLHLSPLVAMAVALPLSVAALAAARASIGQRLAGAGNLSAERLFESLYRVARALEQSPGRAAEQVSGLLRELFDPIEVQRTPRALSGVRVARDGGTLALPVPDLDSDPARPRQRGSIVLRHARQGRRLFTDEDRQLTERVLDQLRRAVAYDRAVERGRAEERTRIAQDLHDDIGARLLTLMYKAPNSEIEDYIRHTLQDLKTLTRGLAAANPRLSHAAAEWKADIGQRLAPAGCDLHWSFTVERDITLNVVQWSGLTRVLRELVSNIISHAHATQVEVQAHFDGRQLHLVVQDDGQGHAPAQWAHGLGLGGVRKRVKLLGGQVVWRENTDRGIRCEVEVPLASPAAAVSSAPRP